MREVLFDRDVVFRNVAVQLNYTRFRRALAPFVNIYQYGRILMDGPRGVQLITLPAFGPTRVIRADDALAPPAGCYIAPQGTDYITQVAMQNWVEMEQSLSCREEWEIAQLLTTGIIDIKGDDPNEPGGRLTLKFEINPPIALSGSDAWDAATAPDVIAWLHAEARKLAAKCGVRPDVLVLGSAAAAAFLANPSVMRERTLLANLRDTAPEVEDAATMYLGRYAALDVWEYDGIFVESELGEGGNYSDVVRDMIPSGCAILGSTAMAGSMVYGGIAVTEQNAVVVHGARRVPISWVDRDNSLWKHRVSSRFAPAPADSGSWQTYSNVLTPSTSPEPETRAHIEPAAQVRKHKA